MISQYIIRTGMSSHYQAHITISFPLAIHRVRGEKPISGTYYHIVPAGDTQGEG